MEGMLQASLGLPAFSKGPVDRATKANPYTLMLTTPPQ